MTLQQRPSARESARPAARVRQAASEVSSSCKGAAEEARDLPRLLVDCSYVAAYPARTGIARVVRKIVEHGRGLGPRHGLNVVPVSLRHKEIRELSREDLAPPPMPSPSRLRRACQAGKDMVLRAIPPAGLGQRLLGAWQDLACRLRPSPPVGRPLHLAPRSGAAREPGDILLLADASWHTAPWEAVRLARRHGVVPAVLVYDLIPLTHPRYCHPVLRTAYARWMDAALRQADCFIAISRTVQDQVRAHVQAACGDEALAHKRFGYFHLGADFLPDPHHPGGEPAVPEKVAALYGQGRPVYLCVSTLAAHKNHAYILDAFEILWARGMDLALHFVGGTSRTGTGILRRIRAHPRYNNHLVHWDDLDDAGLAYCYRHARTLVFASMTEGFGLPIVEGLGMGLPVMASDIPVHREVGRGLVEYFSLDDPGDLARRIRAREEQGIPPDKIPRDFTWQGWEESVEQLLRVLTRLTGSR